MGAKVENSGLELRPHPTFGFDAVGYYGGGPNGTAHTCPEKANGDDVPIVPSLVEALVMAARADVAVDAGGKVVEEAIKGDNMPGEWETWWTNMPAAFRSVFVSHVAVMVIPA